MTDNDTVKLMAQRRSVSPIAMEGPGPSPSELEAMLSLAIRVPDHGKLAPWRLIVFEGEARERAGEIISEVFAQDEPGATPDRLNVERLRLARAPLVVAVVSRAAPHVKIPEWEQIMSAGALCMNLTLAANAIGYSTSWHTEWYAYDRRVLRRFGLADHEKIAGFLHIGSARSLPEDRTRPLLRDVVSRFV